MIANLATNDNLDKYEYGAYSIGFIAHSQFSWSESSLSENIVIFGVCNSSSVHIDNKEKRYLSSWSGSNSRVK